MLVLSRKKNESIVIDGNIKIEVLKIQGNTIRLGITAPHQVKVLRGELAPFGKESTAEETQRLDVSGGAVAENGGA
ncbi:MAG: carbon storage regulator, partial [Planctomycetota bacterium]